ncbi:hypothetical protein EV356DRAFT_559954 [Viridothelium virens]|uniref:SGNH hydrolase n=1 Tax=Viridothelium virens TaxID=1048519 RepID=A0A6A6H5X3_VIRVR|nr:hypothetical protein EV356DRAFT_559954 [Viridothelium virens]
MANDTPPCTNGKIDPFRFYLEWKGHPISDVSTFHSTTLSLRPNKPIIYLAGDSSLDNKAWVRSNGPGGKPLPVSIPNIYDSVLERPHLRPDVAFWLNHFFGERATTLNLAVEESLLRERLGGLLDHDKFIRDHIRAEDFLVVSVGGNDIAYKPTLKTKLHLLRLAWLTSGRSLRQGKAGVLRYFTRLFKDEVEKYISRIVEKQKPRVILVCMIYFPLEASASNQRGWADLPLKLLGYEGSPTQLQTAIIRLYQLATARIDIPGTKVVPCALYDVMNGRRAEDYIARVEPSIEGGRKMALHLRGLLNPFIPTEQSS